MKTLTNPKPIVDIIETMPTLQNRLNQTTEAMTLYLKYLKDEKFERNEYETHEEALLRAEGMLERIYEIVERRKILLNSTELDIDGLKAQLENAYKGGKVTLIDDYAIKDSYESVVNLLKTLGITEYEEKKEQ